MLIWQKWPRSAPTIIQLALPSNCMHKIPYFCVLLHYMKIAVPVPWKLCCLPLTNVQGSENGRFVNLHNSLKFQNSQKKTKKIQSNKNCKKNKQNNLKITQNCCKSSSFLIIADPLWSCVMLICGPLWVLCGPLRYLAIPRVTALDVSIRKLDKPA